MNMGMQAENFSNFAQRYAKSMGDQNILVTFGGTEAYTDGRTINLPALPADATLTPWQVKVYSGYLDHEIAHVKYTDFKNIHLNRARQAMLYGLFNLFEDIRIENKLIENYSGTRSYLDACTQQIEYNKREEDEPETLAYKVLEAIYRCCYEEYRSAEVDFFQKETISQMPDLAKVEKKLEDLKSLRTERDAQRLAEEVMKLLPDLDYGSKSSDLQPQSQPGGGEKPQEIFILPGRIGGSYTSAEKALEEAILFIIKSSDKSKATAVLAEDSTDGEKQGRGKLGYGEAILPPAGTKHDRIFVPERENASAYQQARDSASSEITSLKRMLQIYLQSRTQKSWERGLPEGQLDTDALATFASGSTDIFKKRRSRTLIDTSVQLMVDCSGSMRSSFVRTAAIIMAEALNGVPQIKLSVAGFTTNKNYYSGSTGGRSCGLDLMLYKDFQESYNQCKNRLGAIKTSGYTPLGEAYAHGFTRLIKRKETRKVLWVITDGQPYFPLKDSRHSEYLLMQRVHRRCRRVGIQVVATNVGDVDNCMERYADSVKSIETQEDMPRGMLEILKEISK